MFKEELIDYILYISFKETIINKKIF